MRCRALRSGRWLSACRACVWTDRRRFVASLNGTNPRLEDHPSTRRSLADPIILCGEGKGAGDTRLFGDRHVIEDERDPFSDIGGIRGIARGGSRPHVLRPFLQAGTRDEGLPLFKSPTTSNRASSSPGHAGTTRCPSKGGEP